MMSEYRNHTHPNLSSDKKVDQNVDDSSFTFVVMADTQFGILTDDRDWDTEIEYSQRAVETINQMSPRPLFCCICGDLVNMTASIYANKEKPMWAQPQQPSSKESYNSKMVWSENECIEIQNRQYTDFKQVWSKLHKDIALVCVCGNHDVGNRPTPESIQFYKNHIGNDYLSFWAKKSFCIVLNSSLFNDPSCSMDEYELQLEWLQNQLQTTSKQQPDHIFVFLHHPLFIYNQDEDPKDLIGINSTPNGVTVLDGYFCLPKVYRTVLLDLFRQYNVKATFAGHFHQNMISNTDYGMEMIITGSLSMVLQSTGNAQYHTEPKTVGYRVVNVTSNQFQHKFLSLY